MLPLPPAPLPPASAPASAPPHIPVLRDAAARALLQNAPPDAVLLDATFGAGGHSAEILRRMPPRAKLLAVDCDECAEARAQQFRADPRFHFVRRNFADLAEILRDRAVAKIHGALFDLGASSMQMDSHERGFSFRAEFPPDMRMDRAAPTRSAPTAAQWIRAAERSEMEKVFREFGEEPEARRVARAIAENRNAADSARALADLVRRAKKIPSKPGMHPATRVFQALRIVVNGELESLRRALAAVHRALADGGRLVVIAFHSLEDRIVKQFAAGETLPEIGRVVARRFRLAEKLLLPDAAEISANPRARSARMRVLIKIAESDSGPNLSSDSGPSLSPGLGPDSDSEGPGLGPDSDSKGPGP